MIQLTQKQLHCIEFINDDSNKEIFVCGNCRSGKTFAIIANLVKNIANKNSRNLIVVNDIRTAKLLIKYEIEPICKELSIKFKFNISGFWLEIGERSKIGFMFLTDKSISMLYPRYDNIIIFGKHRLEFDDYKELARISEKIILEDNPFNSYNKHEIENNFEEWVYTYFIRGAIPYNKGKYIESKAVKFELNNFLDQIKPN